MNHPIGIRSVLLFIGLPALWLGSFSISEQISVFEQSAPNFEFVPVTVRASHFADYSPDAITNDFAPVDEDIVVDAQADQGLIPPSLPLPAVQDPNTGNDSDDSQDQEDTQPEAAPTPGNSDQSQAGDNGNKDKDADSPGNSGTDHGSGNGNGGNGNGGGNGKNK